jgi:hypothetical protein
MTEMRGIYPDDSPRPFLNHAGLAAAYRSVLFHALLAQASVQPTDEKPETIRIALDSKGTLYSNDTLTAPEPWRH